MYRWRLSVAAGHRWSRARLNAGQCATLCDDCAQQRCHDVVSRVLQSWQSDTRRSAPSWKSRRSPRLRCRRTWR
jgi:hypothetical protein